MGSLVYAGGMSADDALATQDVEGVTLGAELERIGYAGSSTTSFGTPHAYLELHIEQGPVLEARRVSIGAVTLVQGISWRRVTLRGRADHAGTTPMAGRRDAGVAAARLIAFLNEYAHTNPPTVATVGTIRYAPDAINIIPSRAELTVDLRHPEERRLKDAEDGFDRFVEQLEQDGFPTKVETLARFKPVPFDNSLVQTVEAAATRLGLSVTPMTSGAGHDAQMLARICPGRDDLRTERTRSKPQSRRVHGT